VAKADKLLVQRRTDDIYRILLDGARLQDLRQYVTSQQTEADSPWFLPKGKEPLSDRQLYRYYQAAENLLHEPLGHGRKKLLREHVRKRQNLFARAVTTGDIRTAALILKDEAELRGLYPEKKMKHEHTGSISVDERRARLAGIAAALRDRAGADRN
jgi:hypothetical protein